MKYFHIYNYNGTLIAYCSIKNQNDYEQFKYDIKKIDYKTYIIYYYEEQVSIVENKHVMLIQSQIDFELFFYLHILRHNYFYKNNIISVLEDNNILQNMNDSIHCDYAKFKDYMIMNKQNLDQTYLLKKVRELDKTNNVIDDVLKNRKIEENLYYKELLKELDVLLKSNIIEIDEIFDFNEFMNIYYIKPVNRLYSIFQSSHVVLENVYYINKNWFDNDRNPLEIDALNQDIEYKLINRESYNKKIADIKQLDVFQSIDEEVMFLDYIYGFYNFGEFWDCLKRLMVYPQKNIPLFHLSYNRITNINFFFEKLKYIYPTKYQTQEKNGKLYFFKKVNVSILKGTWRGYYDKYIAYNFNQTFNTNRPLNKTYNIYLKRGKYGRSIQNEESLLTVLKENYNFIIIDGSESLGTIMYYFTNAKVIFGVHGSLMKNVIWCKQNPIFIELCPVTRHACFAQNSSECNFTTFFFACESNNKEEIVLNKEKTNNLISLLNLIIK
jgi:hypothetical protein